MSLISYLIFSFLILFQQGDRLKILQDKWKSIEDISANFTQTSNGNTLSGKFYFKQKDFIRIELKNILLISDGKVNWSYNKKDDKLIISDVYDDDNSLLQLNKFIFEYPSQCEVNEKINNGLQVIELISKNNSLQFKKAVLYPSSDDMISKIDIIDLSGQSSSLTISNIVTNKGLSDSFFSFTPKESTKVIDLR